MNAPENIEVVIADAFARGVESGFNLAANLAGRAFAARPATPPCAGHDAETAKAEAVVPTPKKPRAKKEDDAPAEKLPGGIPEAAVPADLPPPPPPPSEAKPNDLEADRGKVRGLMAAIPGGIKTVRDTIEKRYPGKSFEQLDAASRAVVIADLEAIKAGK